MNMSDATITVHTPPDVLRPIRPEDKIKLFDDLDTRLNKLELMFNWLREFNDAHPDIAAEKRAEIAGRVSSMVPSVYSRSRFYRALAYYQELSRNADVPSYFFLRLGERKRAELLFKQLLKCRKHFWVGSSSLSSECVQLMGRSQG
jgi:hypothetical protein